MKKQLEIATIKANSVTYQGCQLYWLVSRNQLEFLFKEVEISASPPFETAARYQENMLPVINLEQYYGLKEKERNGTAKYLVVRSVNGQNELVKLIIETPQPLKIHKLETGFASLPAALPQNSKDVLGMYSLSAGKLGVVPDFVGMIRTLQLRGNQNM